MDFELENWIQEHELEEGTVQLLLDKGFKSYKSIRHINEDILKKEFKTLSPGQLSLLREGVSIFQPPTHPRAVTEETTTTCSPTRPAEQPHQPSNHVAPEGTQPPSIPDLASVWESHMASPSTPLSPPQAPPSDPFAFGTRPHGGKKLRKVGDYIHKPRATDPNPQDKVTIGGVEFAMAGTSHSNAGKILLPHYMESERRILEGC